MSADVIFLNKVEKIESESGTPDYTKAQEEFEMLQLGAFEKEKNGLLFLCTLQIASFQLLLFSL